jgi:hypothetical protein
MRVYATPPPHKTVESVEHLLHLWNQGEKFLKYREYYICKDDVTKLALSGVREICFVWQNNETQQIHNWVIHL